MRTVIPVLLVLAPLAGMHGQPRPNFSGTWLVVPSRSIWYDNNGRPVNITVFGERFSVEQTELTMTVAIDNERGFKWIYRLDGTPSRNTPPGPDGPQDTSSATAWTDATLTITTVVMVSRDGRPERAETRRTLRFNDDGTLRVEAPWGASGAMIGSVYAKAP